MQELIQTMGYVRGGSGEEKRPGGSGLVALLANPHKTYEEAIGADPFYGKIIGMTEQYLREKGYCMIFYASSDMDDIFRMVTEREVEGVITLSFHKNDCDKIAGLLKRPVVSIDASGYQGKVPNIGLDDWQGGRLMTDYLLECGYGPVYVCAGRDHGVDHIRYLGCQGAWKERMKKGDTAEANGRGYNFYIPGHEPGKSAGIPLNPCPAGENQYQGGIQAGPVLPFGFVCPGGHESFQGSGD